MSRAARLVPVLAATVVAGANKRATLGAMSKGRLIAGISKSF